MILATSTDINTPSIMSMMMSQHNKKSIKIQPDYQSAQHFKAIMQPYLLMARQEQAKPTQWKDSSTTSAMRNEE